MQDSWWTRKIKAKPLMQNEPPIPPPKRNLSAQRLYDDGINRMKQLKKLSDDTRNVYKKQQPWHLSDTPGVGSYDSHFQALEPDAKTHRISSADRPRCFLEESASAMKYVPGVGSYCLKSNIARYGGRFNLNDRHISLYRSASAGCGDTYVNMDFVDKSRIPKTINASERQTARGQRAEQRFMGPGCYNPKYTTASSSTIAEYK